jgi:Na+/H+ ion antiporter subunit
VTLAGVNPGDLRAGIVAIGAATVTSLRLLPPGNLVLRVWQSLVAGIDVARRALDPQLPLRPGVVVFSPRLPGGTALNALCTPNSARVVRAIGDDKQQRQADSEQRVMPRANVFIWLKEKQRSACEKSIRLLSFTPVHLQHTG